MDGRPTALTDPLGLCSNPLGCIIEGGKAAGGAVLDKTSDAGHWLKDKGGDVKDAIAQSEYWDIRSHIEYWEGQKEAGASRSNGALGFLQWSAGSAGSGLLRHFGPATAQESGETFADPCATNWDKALAGGKFALAVASWYGGVSTTAGGTSRLLFGSNARGGTRIFGLRNRWGAKFYTDRNGWFLAIDRASRGGHRLHVLRWKR